MNCRNCRIVDLSALEQNMREIRKHVSDKVRIMAIVKADAYGHGAAETAAAALNGGADMLAVATVGEGCQLREKGISAPVLVLGTVLKDDVRTGIEEGLIQTVCSPEMLHLCETAAVESGFCSEVHLKIDTGMGRIGIRSEREAAEMMTALKECSHVRMTGAYTHFSDADGDDEGAEYTREQFRLFRRITDMLPPDLLLHCSNSAAIHRFPEMHAGMVRAGISLYGYPPVSSAFPLRPCMEWRAKISCVRELPAGSCISYGRTFRSDRPIMIATIACGYGDGYHRSAGAKAHVLIHGRKAKIVGRICMDQMMADVTDIDNVQAGDEAVLIGRDGSEIITAEDLAEWSGTISYEILLSAGSRVERRFVHSGPERNVGR